MDTSEAPPSGKLRLFGGDGSCTPLSPGEWRERVLPAELEDAWDEPDRLHALIELALEDGLETEAARAARRLTVLEPGSERGARVLARALARTGDALGAQRVLEDHVAAFGDSAEVLATLARSRAAAGEHGAALGLLRRALAADPNHRGALRQWSELHVETGGDEDALEAALVEVAGEPGAWRPQLLLGRLALARGEDGIAMDCFRSAIARCGGETAAVHSVAYALADAGRIDDLVEICGELDGPAGAEPHGPDVMRIFERLRRGRAIVADLLERELPLLAHHFGEIETALEPEEEPGGDAEGQLVLEFGGEEAGTEAEAEGEGLRAFSYRAPLWGMLVREALPLLPGKGREATRVTFFAASDEAYSGAERFGGSAQPENALQVAMLPSFLAEVVALTTDARVYCTLPYRDENGLLRRVGRYGFGEMRRAGAAEAPDLLVGCHTSRDAEGTWVELTAWDVGSEVVAGQVTVPLDDSVVASMPAIAARVVSMLGESAEIAELGERAPLKAPERVDAESVEALADLVDMALLEVGIAPRACRAAQERCERLLAFAHRSPDEVLARIAAVAGVVAARDTGEEISDAVREQVRELIGARYAAGDLAGQSLASLLPELAGRVPAL